MKYINSKIIHQFFNFLNTEEISYALIKNVGDELPHKLRVGKDIDIIVKSDSVERFHLIMIIVLIYQYLHLRLVF